ncbi:MAG: enoyl-CoA hydratase [Emcibacter sp.]|nr:enoyl-CoA hydratase [Emcibacter sp.]
MLTLTLNEPDQRNALSEAMLRALHEALLKSYDDPEIKVIVIAAKGGTFSSGHNLKELTEHRADKDKGKDFFQTIMQLCAKVMQAIVNHPRPVIAKVQGMATAAGCQLVASCDLAIATDNSRFCTPGVNIGLFCSTPMVALSRNMPHKQAMQMLLLGDVIDAEMALSYGLINQIVAPDKLDEAVDSYCERLCHKSAVALKIGKQAFYQQVEMPLAKAYEFSCEVMVKNMLHMEAEEGINAFLDKRPPKF